MRSKFITFCIVCLITASGVKASKIVIPMDSLGQANHLKAYGIAFTALGKNIKVDWLLNYRGGSYGMADNREMETLCNDAGVTYIVLSNHKYRQIIKEIKGADFNGAVKQLEKEPKIAVYASPHEGVWDDAVTLALTYAGIPYDKIYADDVLGGALDKYDWVHIHHEDFTGQYGKFYSGSKNKEWYRNDQKNAEAMATKYGFNKVSQMQLAVVKKLRDFVVKGGDMFAMCAASETFDIALAAEGIDICPKEFDGDEPDYDANTKLNFSNCFAFTGFAVSLNAYNYQHSDIDNGNYRGVRKELDNFYLYSFPAKSNIVSAMLCQNHTTKIHGFMGQTTGYRTDMLKPGTILMGSTAESFKTNFDGPEELHFVGEAKYIHGDYGKGTWTFYGGHDPEDYTHILGNKPTDLTKFPHSPGYRLILNNVLYPSVKRDEVPTLVVGDMVKAIAAKDNPGAQVTGASAIMQIYPNPTTRDIVITYAATDNNTISKKVEHVVVMNSEGKIFLDRSYNDDKVQLDVSDYPAGMYFIQVNGVYSGNVVKN